MCGRFYLDAALDEILRHFNIRPMGSVKIRSGEIFPTQEIPVIVANPERELLTMRWGWEAPFLKKTLINARSETLLEKNMFIQAARTRRCLVPASGYYEWAQGEGQKTRYTISVKDQPLIALAGIYQSQPTETGERISAVTIITREAAAPIRRIHDRMPVLLGSKEQDAFLSSDLSELELRHLLSLENVFKDIEATPFKEDRDAAEHPGQN